MTRKGTVIEVLEATASAYPERAALRHKRSDGWTTLSWMDYRDRVHQAGRAFIHLGVGRGSCVVILGGNHPEWFIANFGTIAAGGLPSGIYTTSTAEQCCYIAEHCKAVVAVIEHPGHLKQLAAVREQFAAVVAMEGGDDGDVLSWERFLALGAEVGQERLDERIEALQEDDPCTLIYTSGTTGDPKGVMLSHVNFLWLARALVDVYSVNEEDHGISYLPLSHIAEQVMSLYLPLVI